MLRRLVIASLARLLYAPTAYSMACMHPNAVILSGMILIGSRCDGMQAAEAERVTKEAAQAAKVLATANDKEFRNLAPSEVCRATCRPLAAQH